MQILEMQAQQESKTFYEIIYEGQEVSNSKRGFSFKIIFEYEGVFTVIALMVLMNISLYAIWDDLRKDLIADNTFTKEKYDHILRLQAIG